MYLVFEECRPFVVFAGPAPHVLTVAVVLGDIQDACPNSPHDRTEDEKGNGKRGVVDCNSFSPLVTTAPVAKDDDYRHDERYDGDDEKSDLRPHLLILSPGWEIVPCWNGLGRIEDGECCRQHRQDDK